MVCNNTFRRSIVNYEVNKLPQLHLVWLSDGDVRFDDKALMTYMTELGYPALLGLSNFMSEGQELKDCKLALAGYYPAYKGREEFYQRHQAWHQTSGRAEVTLMLESKQGLLELCPGISEEDAGQAEYPLLLCLGVATITVKKGLSTESHPDTDDSAHFDMDRYYSLSKYFDLAEKAKQAYFDSVLIWPKKENHARHY